MHRRVQFPTLWLDEGNSKNEPSSNAGLGHAVFRSLGEDNRKTAPPTWGWTVNHAVGRKESKCLPSWVRVLLLATTRSARRSGFPGGVEDDSSGAALIRSDPTE